MPEVTQKILFVDDEPNVLSGLQRQLRGQFDMATAVGPRAGLEAIRNGGPFAVVVADHMMPEMTGAEFLRAVREIAPDAIPVMLTGCADLDIAVDALHQGHIFRFLSKPCPRDTLVRALEDSLKQYRLVNTERYLTMALDSANTSMHELNRQLEERVRARTAMISQLFDFVSNLCGMPDLESVAELVVRTTAELLASRRVSLMLPDTSGEYLEMAAAVGIPPEVQRRIRVPVGTALVGRVFDEAQAICAEHADATDQPRHYNTDQFAVWPLASAARVDQGQALGALCVTDPWSEQPYTPEQFATLQAVAEASTIAIENQIRLRERDEARDGVVLALAKLAEHRDPETGAHLERVQLYCNTLSEELSRRPQYAQQVNAEFIALIVRSSPLHDIGKVGIPDRILLKPGRLTPEEFELMKTHAAIGGNTLRSLIRQRRGNQFLQMGMDVAYNHHEKFDGSGYPRGLSGEDIPLSARILAVADVYDALRSRRVYKPAMPHEQAAALLRQESGRHFDPEVVDLFFKIIR